MKEKTLSSHLEELYDKASVIPQQLDESELRLFINVLPKSGPFNILDLGCAEGKLAVEIAKLGHKVTAADISTSQLEKAMSLAIKTGVRLDVVHCDIEKGNEPLGKNVFDYIYLMDVIEHFKNPVAALENIRPMLAENGRLIIHTPNVFALDRLLYYLVRPRKRVNFYESRKLWDLHFQTYDYMTLEKTLNFVGYKVEEILPTRLSIPFLTKSRWLASRFPFMADTLLFSCRKEKPIDVDAQIDFWKASALQA